MTCSDQRTLRPLNIENRPWTPNRDYASRSAIRKHAGPYQASVPVSIAGLDVIGSLDDETLADADEAT